MGDHQSINFKLDSFDGPLDLLLQMIDREQIDIFDIPIVQITDQFMDYVSTINDNLDALSSFLTVASELLDIKCRMLLPNEENKSEDEDQDPRMELVRRLLEYKLYKEAGKLLLKEAETASKISYREKTIQNYEKHVSTIDYSQLIGDKTLSDLRRTFEAAVRRKEIRQDPMRASFGKIEKEPVDSKKSEAYIRSFLKDNPETTFFALTKKNREKEEIIVDFMLLLEMAKTGEIELFQSQIFQDISIVQKEKEDEKDKK